MPQLYLNLPTIFIEIAATCTKLSVHTCFNKAGRQGIKLHTVKYIFLRIELRYRFEIFIMFFDI